MSYIFPSGTKRNILAAEKDSDLEKGKEKEEIKKVADDTKAEECEKCKEKGEPCDECKAKQTDIADENKDAVVEDGDFAFNAIKDLPGIKDKADALLGEIKEKVEEVAQVIQENIGEADGAKAKVEEIAAIVQDGKEELAKVEPAKEEPAKEVAKEEPEEVEIEIEDEEPKEVDISVDEKGAVSIPGVEEKAPAEEVEITIGEDADKKEPDDIVKKSTEACGCAAGSKGEFIRLAKLSPKNRESVRTYWLALGFPKDYVEAMVKDY